MDHGRVVKQNLARLIGDEGKFAYFTFDDDVQRTAAQADPVGYAMSEAVELREIGRCPADC